MSKLIAAIFIWGSIQVACANDAALQTIAAPVSCIGTQTVWNNRSVEVVVADGKDRMIAIVLDKDGSHKAKDRYSVPVNGRPADSESKIGGLLKDQPYEELFRKSKALEKEPSQDNAAWRLVPQSKAEQKKDLNPPVLAFFEEGQTPVTVVGKRTDIAGLIEICNKAISRFGSIGGVDVVFKDNVSLGACLSVHRELLSAKLGPNRFFVCPSKLWNPRSITPAQWRRIEFP